MSAAASGSAFVPSKGVLIRALEEGYRGPCWHGPSVRVVLRGVDSERAQLRLDPERNSVWELVLHLAYGRHRALLHMAKLTGGPAQRFPRRMRSSWWPRLPEPLTAAAWDADRALLETYQGRLIEALGGVPGSVLAHHRRGKKWPLGTEILGLATHDAYHAGQIRLMLRTSEAE